MRTLLAGDGEAVCSGAGGGDTNCSGEIEGDGDSPGVGEGTGLGRSCAAAITAKLTQESSVRMLNGRSRVCGLSIIAPVQVRKNIVTPFAVPQKFFIEIICDKLIVQTVEASKVIDCALGRIFARSPGFH